jgi:hypothetical protein
MINGKTERMEKIWEKKPLKTKNRVEVGSAG